MLFFLSGIFFGVTISCVLFMIFLRWVAVDPSIEIEE